MFRLIIKSIINLIIFVALYFSIISVGTLVSITIIEILIVGILSNMSTIFFTGLEILGLLIILFPINLIMLSILWYSTSTNKKNKFIVFLGLLVSFPSFLVTVLLLNYLFNINNESNLNLNPVYNMIRNQYSHIILSVLITFLIRIHIIFLLD